MSDGDTLSARVAEEIRAMLARKRMSGRELARRLGVASPWVSNRLTCQIEIGLDELERIAAALDVEVAALMPALTVRPGAGRETMSHSSAPADQPMTERMTPGQYVPHHIVHSAHQPHEIAVTSRTGTRRPRVRSWSHDGAVA